MIKLMFAGALALALVGDASAQTSSQWSQLLTYVGNQTKLIIDLRARMERMEASDAQQRATINTAIGALDQERCRVSRLIASIRDQVERNIPMTWVEDVACSDLKSPPPAFPQPLPAPQ